ncbi:MAG: hypothetical protein JRI77_04510, partial [Deltaproteobacteria bacterium]|nr:hypothetical protein [Deltaproteobacteria bacterium]
VEGIRSIEGLYLIGDSQLGIVTFGSRKFDIFAVAAGLDDRQWYTARIKEPPGINLVVTPANSQMSDCFLTDLREIIEMVKCGKISTRNEPIY